MSTRRGDQSSGARQLTLAQVAQRLNMSVRTIERWAQTGRIPPVGAHGAALMFREADVDTVALRRSEPGG